MPAHLREPAVVHDSCVQGGGSSSGDLNGEEHGGGMQEGGEGSLRQPLLTGRSHSAGVLLPLEQEWGPGVRDRGGGVGVGSASEAGRLQEGESIAADGGEGVQGEGEDQSADETLQEYALRRHVFVSDVIPSSISLAGYLGFGLLVSVHLYVFCAFLFLFALLSSSK